jgi:hypothetical protein
MFCEGVQFNKTMNKSEALLSRMPYLKIHLRKSLNVFFIGQVSKKIRVERKASTETPFVDISAGALSDSILFHPTLWHFCAPSSVQWTRRHPH